MHPLESNCLGHESFQNPTYASAQVRIQAREAKKRKRCRTVPEESVKEKTVNFGKTS
jgi:hypothetical protein